MKGNDLFGVGLSGMWECVCGCICVWGGVGGCVCVCVREGVSVWVCGCVYRSVFVLCVYVCVCVRV